MSHPFVPFTVGDLKHALEQLPDDLPLIYSSDDEGNSYQFVHYLPSIKYHKFDIHYLEIVDEDESDDKHKNKAVCIN